MMNAAFPQIRLVPIRMLKPETAERLLNMLAGITGIRRMMVQGPGLPKVVPYGPARGSPNPHSDRKAIHIADAEVALRVQVGMVILEVEDASVIEEIRSLCDDFFVEFPYLLQEGKFMKTAPTLVDYAKYGPDADTSLVGLTDPRIGESPVIIRTEQ
ncbi:methyl-coenzyme M reductase operon protein D [Methanoculleus sp. FWC-SCC3]|uniref:Methyl-coenzyme M reductase operon protein D n=1 Tax=Methanoculleus methanifontis TaxID=2584086 RepID=A0ABT8M105_9EURY|nr:methyl-coenzyme M reductase operon protein D [Methanoculleus sp. FWC-SCC3]MDN7012061.1 methyl-coenzyme M reductase operon protein D [Methanoculleus sp. FWC-SCC3]